MLSIFEGKHVADGSTNAARPNAGEILTPRTPLLLRGHTMECLAVADGERRGSGISHSAAALIAASNIQNQADASTSPEGIRRASSIRMPAFNMNNVLAAGNDELDGLLTNRHSTSNANTSRLTRRDSSTVPDSNGTVEAALALVVTPRSRAPLVLQAAVALWRLRDEARGFRKWKDVLAEPLDLRAQLPELLSGVTMADEARRLLLTAETKRQVAQARRTSNAVWDDQPAIFSRAESNLLVLWAREAHAKTFRDVDDLTLREVVRFLHLKQYQDGEPLFFEGEPGDMFYLLLDGTVAVYSGASAVIKSRSGSASPQGSRQLSSEDLLALGRRVFTYRTGESFGETAMFTKDAGRTASAVAAGASEVLELAKDVYLRTLKKFHRQYYERARRLHFAQRVQLFREWPRPRVSAVADVLELKKLSFGDRLLVEGHAAPGVCFIVLSGALKLTTQITIDDSHSEGGSEDNDDDTHISLSAKQRRPADSNETTSAGSSASSPVASSSKKLVRRARRGGRGVTIVLHVARPGEIIAIESILNPGWKPTYSVVADSAEVEVYALAESDARTVLGGPGSVVYQQLRQISDTTARQRRSRLDVGRRALQEQERSQHPPVIGTLLEEGGFCDAKLLIGDDFDIFPADADSKQETQSRPLPIETVAAEHSTYIPHLDTRKLLSASVSLGSALTLASPSRWSPHQPSTDERVDPEVSTVAPPRMLSTCVKNFVFTNSDTLADDYVERLQTQFPVQPPRQPPSVLLGTCSSPSAREPVCAITSRSPNSCNYSNRHRRHRSTQQPQQQLLGQHMRRLYETKMHWDTTRKSFVLVPPQLPNFNVSTNASACELPVASPPPSTARTGAELARLQRSAQETARRLLDERSRKQSKKRVPSRDSTTSSFVHFF